MAIQVLTGLVISFIPFGDYQWIREAFEPIDRHFPAFRTMFLTSPDPTAGKVYLLLWWTVFIPWGVVWIWRFSDRFNPVNLVALQSKFAVLKFFLLACFGFLLVTYLSAFSDYGGIVDRPSHVPSRADIIPAIVLGGVFSVSIFQAVTSLMLVIAIMVFGACIRALIQPHSPDRESK